MTTAVVLSTYNGEQYIKEQLLSLLGQKRKADKVYISDDGSSDSTVEIVKSFIKSNCITNWIMTVNEKNKGWKKNFHDLILSAEEDLIFLCDQDDVWFPEKIDEMANIMEEHQEINLLACGYEPQYDDETRKITKRILKTMNDSGDIYPISLNRKFMNVLRPGCAYVVRKSFCHMINSAWNINLPHDAMIWRSAVIDGSAYIYDRNLFKWRRYVTSSSSPARNADQYKNKYELQKDVFINSHESHILYLEAIRELVCSDRYVLNNKEMKILNECKKYESMSLSAYINNNIFAYIKNSIRYYSFAPSFKSIIWGLYVLIRTQ